MHNQVPHCTLGGVRIDLLPDAKTAVDVIVDRARHHDKRHLAVASVNLDHIHHFARRPALFESQPVQWHCLLDGIPVVRRVHAVTGKAWPQLAGSDLLVPVLEQCAAAGISIGFLGGTTETHRKLRQELGRTLPLLRIAGTWAPERAVLVDAGRSATLADQVRESATDILVVSLGKPRQEEWIAEYGVATGAGVSLAFGAAIDFVAGTAKRAPEPIRKAGLEWAWRFIREPVRLSRRYLVQAPRALVGIHTWTSAPTEKPSRLEGAKS